MNLSDIITKCYILALIIRDDGERLLLGDGIYEFKSSLQHFVPNIYQNDIVELQGTDGQLLAGQVRRSATQAFDGYIADGTIGKTDTEQSRRRFLGFFRKKHHYKVVYIMTDGTAVQRDRGYIVDAPAVQELYQRFPEYHIGLNFEDPNYYEYSENDEGEEIYTHIQAIALFRELEAGLVWDAFGAVSDDIAWIEYMTKNSTDGYILIGNGLPVEAPLSLTHLYGNTTQQTYSGKNLFDRANATENKILVWSNAAYTDENKSIVGDYISASEGQQFSTNYNAFIFCYDNSKTYLGTIQTGGATIAKVAGGYFLSFTIPSGYGVAYIRVEFRSNVNSNLDMTQQDIMVNIGSPVEPYEPYCGGVPAPNPDFPQVVNTVSGEQTVKITGKNLLPTITGSDTYSGVTLTSTNGTITSSGTATASMTFTLTGSDGIKYRQTYWQTLVATTTNSIPLQKGTYYFSAGTTTAGNVSTQYRLVDLGQKLEDGTSISLNSSFTITEPKRLCITIYVNNGNAPNVNISDLQLELGNQKTDFEPYQSQSYEINLEINLPMLGKNKFSSYLEQGAISTTTGKNETTTATNRSRAQNQQSAVESRKPKNLLKKNKKKKSR